MRGRAVKVPKNRLKDITFDYDKSLGSPLYDRRRDVILYPYIKIKYSKLNWSKKHNNSIVNQLLMTLHNKLLKDNLLVHGENDQGGLLEHFNQCYLVMNTATEKHWFKLEYKLEKKKGSLKWRSSRGIKMDIKRWTWYTPSILSGLKTHIIYIPETAFQKITEEQLVYEL